MKSKELIQRKIDELNRLHPGCDNYEIGYLIMSLNKSETDLKILLMKYEIELKENSEIVKALRWVLED